MKSRRLRAVAAFSLCAIVGWSLVGTTAAGARRSSGSPKASKLRLQRAGTRPTVRGKLSVAQTRALRRGYLVPDEAKYAKAKATAARRAATTARSGDTPPPRSPAFEGAPLRSWQGIDDPGHSPTDNTGAIGTSRYIELVNSKLAIYDRRSNVPISVGTLNDLVGEAGNTFDPHMLWDPGTIRFYYVLDNIVSSFDNRLEVGFSKTPTPNSTADFCKYSLGTGSDFYDYPKLGDTSNLWMIGANVFSAAGPFLRSDVVALTKPAAGSTCPASTSFTTSSNTLVHSDASPAFTPVPVNQTDTSGTGWIVSAAFPGTGSSNFLSVFQVTKNASNQMVVGPAKKVSVASYSTPAEAVQKGSAFKLDSSDTRLTNAVSAIDPSRGFGTSVAIWTQHTVLGGAGAQVRWYEINSTPATPVPFQTGTAGSSALYAFNGAISPDRRVNGASVKFGGSMVLGYNTSSSTQFINVMAVSRRAGKGQSDPEVIKAGTEPQTDFSCDSGTCRSGDYGGASPDPASDTSKSDGVVWMTNQFPGTDWHTWNFAVRPSSAPK